MSRCPPHHPAIDVRSTPEAPRHNICAECGQDITRFRNRWKTAAEIRSSSPLIPTDITKVDHETGNVHVPGRGDLPLVGPTSGSAYEDLKHKEAQNLEAMAKLKRYMASTFQCTQCRKIQPGTDIRVKWMKVEGVDTETLVCSDRKCDAPVIMVKDAGGKGVLLQ